MLEETNRLHLLFDFYGKLLKDKQKQYFEMYYQDDLSLSEIAELQEISRQAVYEHVKRVANIMEQYESKLGLLIRYEKRRVLLDELQQELSTEGRSESHACALVGKLLALEMDID
jgi:uncharacterized protein